MTAADLALARDGDPDATSAAQALWTAITDEVAEVRAGVALDAVGAHVGADTDVPDLTLGEAVIRTGSYLANSRHMLGYHGSLGDGLPEADPRVGGYSALRRSGTMSLLSAYKSRRAGVI